MTPEERQLVTGLFERLRQSDHGDQDPEARELIEAALTAHPRAPYLMTQLLLVQDRALSTAQSQIRGLQQDLATARSAARPSPGDRSFLGSAPVRGPWGDAVPASAPPSSSYQPAAPAPSTGSSFLRGAMQTAAGVAGGALLFEGINSLFHLGSGGWGHGLMPGSFLGDNAPTLIEETVINNYGGDPSGSPLPSAADVSDGANASPDDITASAADWPDDSDIDNV